MGLPLLAGLGIGGIATGLLSLMRDPSDKYQTTPGSSGVINRFGYKNTTRGRKRPATYDLPRNQKKHYLARVPQSRGYRFIGRKKVPWKIYKKFRGKRGFRYGF